MCVVIGGCAVVMIGLNHIQTFSTRSIRVGISTAMGVASTIVITTRVLTMMMMIVIGLMNGVVVGIVAVCNRSFSIDCGQQIRTGTASTHVMFPW